MVLSTHCFSEVLSSPGPRPQGVSENEILFSEQKQRVVLVRFCGVHFPNGHDNPRGNNFTWEDFYTSVLDFYMNVVKGNRCLSNLDK